MDIYRIMWPGIYVTNGKNNLKFMGLTKMYIIYIYYVCNSADILLLLLLLLL
jgi:hypothetical protein